MYDLIQWVVLWFDVEQDVQWCVQYGGFILWYWDGFGFEEVWVLFVVVVEDVGGECDFVFGFVQQFVYFECDQVGKFISVFEY